jgi:hypothetical protein
MAKSRFPKSVYAALKPPPRLPEYLEVRFGDLTRDLYSYLRAQNFPKERREKIMSLVANAYGMTADGADK